MRTVSLLALCSLVLCVAVALGCDDGDAAGGGAASGGGADTSLPGDPGAGQAVYQRACLACHGADGKGNGGLTGANFIEDRTRLAKGNDALLRAIREGVPNKTPPMPPQAGILSDQEQRDALSYIRQTFGGAQ